jgi:phage shock protein PspC (stress-responsive transcriptional regulator)
VPDYNFGGEGASMTVQVISYIASGLIGILAVGLVIYVIARLILRNEK